VVDPDNHSAGGPLGLRWPRAEGFRSWSKSSLGCGLHLVLYGTKLPEPRGCALWGGRGPRDLRGAAPIPSNVGSSQNQSGRFRCVDRVSGGWRGATDRGSGLRDRFCVKLVRVRTSRPNSLLGRGSSTRASRGETPSSVAGWQRRRRFAPSRSAREGKITAKRARVLFGRCARRADLVGARQGALASPPTIPPAWSRSCDGTGAQGG